MNNYERELSWDEEINQESEFTLLEDGDYDFEVIKFERGRSKGSTKIPPSNMAILTLRVGNGIEKTTVTDYLVLHSSLEWKLSQFFIAIGDKKHGEPLRMNWNNVVGKKGRCKIKVENYAANNGEERQSNKIDKYYDYVAPQPTQSTYNGYAQPTSAPKGFTPGDF